MGTEISAIICHHKGNFIYKAVESIKSSYGVTFEIIVITSDSELALKGIKGCLLIHSEAGPAEKRNIGSRVAKGEYLAFFDDDVEVDEYCLENLRVAFLTDDVGMVYGKLYNMERRRRFDEAGGFLTNTGFIWSRAGQNDLDKGQYDKYEPIFSGKSASCMIRAEVFNKVGGFDEDFFILGEESDLSWRVWLYGYKVVWQPKSIAYHAFNTKFKPAKEYYTSSRVHYNGCRNYITMLYKNLEARNLWKILPIHILIWFGAGIAMVITGKVKAGANILRGIWYCLVNFQYLTKKRRKVQASRAKTDIELWPYLFRRSPKGYYTQRFRKYLRLGLHG